ADLLAEGARIDLLSTHSKYAPSQARWLQPLDPVLADAMAKRAIDLCTFAGDLLCVPRNIDVRVMWVRRDLVDPAPATWGDRRPRLGGFCSGAMPCSGSRGANQACSARSSSTWPPTAGTSSTL